MMYVKTDFWSNKFELKATTEEHYALYYKTQDAFDIKELEAFAKSKGLKLKIIHKRDIRKNTEKNVTTACPKEFLELLYGAEFVFTSSFHGLAFSLIFQKPFYASFKTNSGRAESLLLQLDLNHYLLEQQSPIPSYYKEIDYHTVENKISDMRKKSYEYLKDSTI